jgi:hypothetical protein
MAKKSRRARRRATGAAEPVRVNRPDRPVITSSTTKEVDFVAEYHYVVEDLRRIAIIAAALLALLVALAILIA